ERVFRMRQAGLRFPGGTIDIRAKVLRFGPRGVADQMTDIQVAATHAVRAVVLISGDSAPGEIQGLAIAGDTGGSFVAATVDRSTERLRFIPEAVVVYSIPEIFFFVIVDPSVFEVFFAFGKDKPVVAQTH